MSAVPCMWAQSKEQIIITFEVHDALKPNVSLEPNKITFKLVYFPFRTLKYSIVSVIESYFF